MNPLHDGVFEHLRDVSDWPELEGTRYRATERIGRGGMGAVYSATDSLLHRQVAIKILNVELRATDASARLAREAKILAALEHPGIVPVHDLGSLPDGRMFYVMKLVQGQRLDEYVKGTRLRSELLQVFLKICDAVGFAHAKGIVHRDLKPQNIMIGSYGEVLVLDWGIAGFLASLGQTRMEAPAGSDTGDTRATRDGMVIGTPGYMPPEQARGDISQVSERSDVFSLGAILFFLLTGSHPRSSSADRPAELRPSSRVPKPLRAVCARAMATEPADRYPSVAELGADIQRYLTGIRISAYREGPGEMLTRLLRTYRTPVLLVLAYLVMRTLLLFFTGR